MTGFADSGSVLFWKNVGHISDLESYCFLIYKMNNDNASQGWRRSVVEQGHADNPSSPQEASQGRASFSLLESAQVQPGILALHMQALVQVILLSLLGRGASLC